MFKGLRLVNQVWRIQRIAYASTTAAAKKPFPIITCKNTKYNLMSDGVIQKGQAKPEDKKELASHGWHHRKAKGDHFIIHAQRNVIESNFDKSTSFDELQLNSQLIHNLKEKHDIHKATKLQKSAIEKILKRNHVLIAAETGCGKTHAYLLPMIHQILQEKDHETSKRQFNSPLAVVLTPGRELAQQIAKFAEELSDGLGVGVKVITGGSTKKKVMNPEFEDIDILVGSIGAISKLTTTGIYRMNHVRHVVLDEADTLLDDSFNEKLEYFVRRFPFHRDTQMILASATMPTNTEEVFGQIIDTSTLKKVVSDDLHKILPYVTQKFIKMNKSDRPEHLLRMVKSDLQKKRPVIVFANKSATSDYVSLFLNENGVECLNVNGDMQMRFREGRFDKFQNGEVNIISTTDCIGRGLNTLRARHIINFDFPLHVSDYIHRCGRIGRLGSDSNSSITNFVSSFRELELVHKIEQSARSDYLLENVNANIKSIITTKIQKDIDKYESFEDQQMRNLSDK